MNNADLVHSAVHDVFKDGPNTDLNTDKESEHLIVPWHVTTHFEICLCAFGYETENETKRLNL